MNSQILDLQPIYSSEEELDESDSPKEKQMESKTPSISEMIFNAKYKINSSLLRSIITLTKESSPAYFLGKEYDFDQRSEFAKHFQSTLWMSHREISESLGEGLSCAIRCAQMLLGSVLRRNNPKAKNDKIIELFREGNQHPLSFQNITSQGKYREKSIFLFEAVSVIFSLLSKQIEKKKIQDLTKSVHSPLKIEISHQNYHNHLLLLEKPDAIDESRFPMTVTICTNLIGQNYFPQDCLPHLKHIMRMESFCGMMAGKGCQTLFIPGFQDEYMIVLDPHYVQKSGSNEQIFFKKNPRGIPMTKLSSKFVLCFFMRTKNEYLGWLAEMAYTMRIYSPRINWAHPEQSMEEIEQYRKEQEDEQFQVL